MPYKQCDDVKGPCIQFKMTLKAEKAVRRYMTKKDIKTKAEAINMILEESDLAGILGIGNHR